MKTSKTLMILMATCGLMSACDNWNSFDANDCNPNDDDTITKINSKYYKCEGGNYVETYPECVNPGSYQYITNDKGECREEQCNGFKWKKAKDSTFSCVTISGKNVGIGECLNGTNSCETGSAEDAFKICVNGQWIEISDTCGCNADSEKSCTEVVNNYGMKCGAGATTYKPCIDDDNGNYTSCISNTECGKCLNGTTKCDSNVVSTCKNGDWEVTEECPNGCDSNTNQCKTPNSCETVGAFTCSEDNIVLRCNEQNILVNHLNCASENMKCKDGKCVECLDGSTQCNAASTEALVCKNNRWDSKQKCDENQVCEAGECKDKNAECNDDDDCDGKVCKNGKCVEKVCDEGKYRCDENGVPQVCENNSWGPAGTCGENQVCEDGECKDKNTGCKSDEGITCSDNQTRKYCKDGQWQEESCGEKICKDGNCVEKCNENTLRCSNDIVEKCVYNEWKEDHSCDNGEKCDAGQCKPICPSENEGEQCGSNDEVAICHNGFCIKNRDKCDLNKEGGALHCQADNITHIKCTSTIGWNVRKCPDDKICLGGWCHVAGECVGENGDEQCLQNEKCDAGQCKPTCSSENEGEQCDSQSVCHKELCIKKGDKCNDNTPFCNNNESYQCSNGTWKTTTCPECIKETGRCSDDNILCINGNCEGTNCTNDAQLLENNGSNLVCLNEQWTKVISENKCDSENKAGESCGNDNEQGVCVNKKCVSLEVINNQSTRCFGEYLIGIQSDNDIQSDGVVNYTIYSCNAPGEGLKKCENGKCISVCNNDTFKCNIDPNNGNVDIITCNDNYQVRYTPSNDSINNIISNGEFNNNLCDKKDLTHIKSVFQGQLLQTFCNIDELNYSYANKEFFDQLPVSSGTETEMNDQSQLCDDGLIFRSKTTENASCVDCFKSDGIEFLIDSYGFDAFCRIDVSSYVMVKPQGSNEKMLVHCLEGKSCRSGQCCDAEENCY